MKIEEKHIETINKVHSLMNQYDTLKQACTVAKIPYRSYLHAKEYIRDLETRTKKSYPIFNKTESKNREEIVIRSNLNNDSKKKKDVYLQRDIIKNINTTVEKEPLNNKKTARTDDLYNLDGLINKLNREQDHY